MQQQVMEHCGYVHEQSSRRFVQLLDNSWYKNLAAIEHELMLPKYKESKP